MNLPFDSIYILTCKQTEARVPAVLNQLTCFDLNKNLPVTTFYSPSSILYRHFISQLPMSDWNRNHPYGFWCTNGHYLIAHNALDHGFKRVLILEDDIRLLNDKTRFYAQLSELPETADWAHLDWWPFFYCDYWKNGNFIRHMQMHREESWISWDTDPRFKIKSAGAYIVSEKGLKAIIDIQDSYIPGSPHKDVVGGYRTADEIFDRKLADHFNLTCYISNPLLARQVNMGGHGGGADRLYLKGQMVSPFFNLRNYVW